MHPRRAYGPRNGGGNGAQTTCHIEVFLRQNPRVYDGLSDPSKAETWIFPLERILQCTDREHMNYATFRLTNSAEV